MTKEEQKEEKRRIVLASINFYRKERNKHLFRINKAKLKRKEALIEGEIALAQAKLIKNKIINEVKNNADILSQEDRGIIE